MLLKLTCYLTFLFLLAQCHTNSTKLDFTSECSRIANYQKNDTDDYCSYFNDSCRAIFDRKQVCQSIELNCSQKTGSCILSSCDEYTPDLTIRKFQDPLSKTVFNSDTKHRWHSYCLKLSGIQTMPNFTRERQEERFQYCCSIQHRRLEEKIGNVCRNRDKSCEFHICSEDEVKKKKEEVENQAVRLTAVSAKDIDVTELAIDSVFYSYFTNNLTRDFCQHFHNRCNQMIERYFGNGDFQIKESTCIPGKVAQTACILIRTADMESNDIKEVVADFHGSTVTGKLLDMMTLAAGYGRYSKDGRYCKNFMEGCTLVMNIRNIFTHKYQRKEVTCDKCILVESSETDKAHILDEYPQPSIKRKLRLSTDTEHLIPLKYGFQLYSSQNLPTYIASIYPLLEYQCANIYKSLEAKIENICRKENDTLDTTVKDIAAVREYCSFHRCTDQEKSKTLDSLVVRHTMISEKDLDMTAMARDLALMIQSDGRDIDRLDFCREFQLFCYRILDMFFFDKVKYQVKENTCHAEIVEERQQVPARGACILSRVGDK